MRDLLKDSASASASVSVFVSSNQQNRDPRRLTAWEGWRLWLTAGTGMQIPRTLKLCLLIRGPVSYTYNGRSQEPQKVDKGPVDPVAAAAAQKCTYEDEERARLE